MVQLEPEKVRGNWDVVEFEKQKAIHEYVNDHS